ncbi:hypothetical protein ACEQ8H_001477 [Pleosporales sp. CAS-2024a]
MNASLELASLGLRNYSADPSWARAVFKHPAVIQLYRLIRDRGTVFDRKDPNLLDDELDALLRKFGPLIWPHPAEGNRNHLLVAETGTLYEADLIYPLHEAIIKHHIRRILLAKKINSRLNYEASIGATDENNPTSTSTSGSTTRQNGANPSANPTPARRNTATGKHNSIDASNHSNIKEVIVAPTTSGRRTSPDSTETDNSYSSVELRLYLQPTHHQSDRGNAVFASTTMFVAKDCSSFMAFFNQIREEIYPDCNSLTFHLPEDISHEGTIRLHYGMDDTEAKFHQLCRLLQDTRRYPGKPQHISIEVEVALGLGKQLSGTSHGTNHTSASTMSRPFSSLRPSHQTLSPYRVSSEKCHTAQSGSCGAYNDAQQLLGIVSSAMQFDCFDHLSSARCHYYSTRTLFSLGVWVGYLAPDKQNKPYKGLPSFHELKKNCNDMILPFPPPSVGTAAKNYSAVCRGCVDYQPSLLTVRELAFVKDRKLVIMPLDGEDEMGMFCILIPQPHDRAMKSLQSWRPYEVKNGGDGKVFNNNITLVALRKPENSVCTLEAVRAELRPEETTSAATLSWAEESSALATFARISAQPAKQVATKDTRPAILGQSPAQPTSEDEDEDDASLITRRSSALPKRGADKSISLAGERPKRKRIESFMKRLPFNKEPPIRMARASVVDANEPSMTTLPNVTVGQLTPIAHVTFAANTLPKKGNFVGTNRSISAVSQEQQPDLMAPKDSAETAGSPTNMSQGESNNVNPKASSTASVLEAVDIDIMWKVEFDGGMCDVYESIEKCKSFKAMLETMRVMVEAIPEASAILEKTKAWILTYWLPDGTKRMIIGRPGSESVFMGMLNDAAKFTAVAQQGLNVELKALG